MFNNMHISTVWHHLADTARESYKLKVSPGCDKPLLGLLSAEGCCIQIEVSIEDWNQVLQTTLSNPLGPIGSLSPAQGWIWLYLEAKRPAGLGLRVAQEESKQHSLPFFISSACIFFYALPEWRWYSKSSLAAYILCPESSFKHSGMNSPKWKRIKIKIISFFQVHRYAQCFQAG